jgi:NAD(P)-dependent dehydrogenase (short-subunit alcohol dehydrogenase family)
MVVAQPIAWITGGGSGIGRATALRLVQDGWTIALTSRTAKDLDEIAALPEAKGRVHAYACDVTDRSGMAAACERIEKDLGPIKLAFLAAGIYLPFGIEQFSAEKIETLFRVNVGGVANAIEAVMPRFLARNEGRLAIVTSFSQYRGLCRTSGYGASKAALLVMAESLRLQTMETGITVQVVVPGYFESRMTASAPFPLPGIISAEDAAEQAVAGMKTNTFEILVPEDIVSIVQQARGMPSDEYFKMAAKTPLFGGVPDQ